MKKFLQVIVIALAFAVASAPAWALGLGQIQVKSRLNEPFLAHIPIISNDPAEIQELSAKLADPETFVRVGLPLPDKLVSDLQFAIETNDEGMPYVKVTSVTPVALSELDFLVEVRWSGGRLVREYTALMAPPSTLAGAPPVIHAPTVEDAPVVTRPVMAPVDTVTHPAAVASASGNAPVAETPSTAVAARSVPSVLPSGRTYGPIRSGETLGEIARAMAGTNGDAVATMQQLLDLNRDAFIGGNVHRLKAGAVLRTPEGSVAVKPAAAERAAVASAAASVANRSAQVAESSTVANAMGDRRTATTASVARPSSEARLKIVAPAANTDSPTTRSGGGTQGDGDMLQQQLQQANESIATKDAEINELKSRVAELEQLKNKQAQLIALKDTQLASAQKNVETQSTATGKEANGASPFPWLGLAIGVLAVAALAAAGAYFLRRKTPESRTRAATPQWLQNAATGAGVTTAPAAPAETSPEPPRDDHDALSKIAKARACTVVGDKAGARAILEEVLVGTLLPETRTAAQQLLNTLG